MLHRSQFLLGLFHFPRLDDIYFFIILFVLSSATLNTGFISINRECDFYLILLPTLMRFLMVSTITCMDLLNYLLLNYFSSVFFLLSIDLVFGFYSLLSYYYFSVILDLELDFMGEIRSMNVRAVCLFYYESTNVTFLGVIFEVAFLR